MLAGARWAGASAQRASGGLAGLGCLAAAGHPLSILAAIVAAPLKPFRPGLPAGAFSALVEVHLRKPAYGDFLALRDDAQTLRISRMTKPHCLTGSRARWVSVLRWGSRAL